MKRLNLVFGQKLPKIYENDDFGNFKNPSKIKTLDYLWWSDCWNFIAKISEFAANILKISNFCINNGYIGSNSWSNIILFWRIECQVAPLRCKVYRIPLMCWLNQCGFALEHTRPSEKLILLKNKISDSQW